MNDPGPTTTSPRKAEIFAVLQGEMRRRRRRRQAVRSAAAAAALCITAAGTIVLLRGTPTLEENGAPPTTVASGESDHRHDLNPAPDPTPSPDPHTPHPAVPPRHTPAPLRVAEIRTDPGILERLAAAPAAGIAVRPIGDEELLAALDEAGQGERFGLVRAGMRVAVVCQTCADGSTPSLAWMQELRREWSGDTGRGGGSGWPPRSGGG